MPQCETTGTTQAERCSDLITCAPGAALPTRMMVSAPASRSRCSCGVMSASLSSNFSAPASLIPAASAAVVRPARLDSPQPLFTSIRPGFLAPNFVVAYLIKARSTSTSTAETRKTKFGLAPLRVILVAAAHTPMNGTFTELTSGTIASDTGLSMPPKRITQPSLSINSRAAVCPLAGFDSSSRRTSSSMRPPSTPPFALISSMAIASPRLIPSPDFAEGPESAADRAGVDDLHQQVSKPSNGPMLAFASRCRDHFRQCWNQRTTGMPDAKFATPHREIGRETASRFGCLQPTISLPEKNWAISTAAVSKASDPCTEFSPIDLACSLRMLPSAAFEGSVAPITSRYLRTALSPSRTWTTTGPEIMKSTNSPKNGRAL